MKKITIALLLAILAMLCCLQVYAAEGNVTYEGRAAGIVFAPGSDQSLTDLFSSFKGVMPGDTLTQTITLKNSAAAGTKIDIYMRAQSTDEASAELLSALKLRVTLKSEQGGKELFHAAPSDTTSLKTWIFLGTLEAGGEVDLELSLSVPLEMDNEMQGKLGSVKWEFRTNDFSVGVGGRSVFSNLTFVIWLVIAICAVMMLILILYRERDEKKKAKNGVAEAPLSGEEEEKKEG
jgi:hypothetical protein